MTATHRCSCILILQILKFMYWESDKRVGLCLGPAVGGQDSRSSLATYQWSHAHRPWVCFGHLVRSLEHSRSAFPHLYNKNTYLLGLLWGLTQLILGKCSAHYEGGLHKCVLLHRKKETHAPHWEYVKITSPPVSMEREAWKEQGITVKNCGSEASFLRWRDGVGPKRLTTIIAVILKWQNVGFFSSH